MLGFLLLLGNALLPFYLHKNIPLSLQFSSLYLSIRKSILFGSSKQISVFKINAGYRLPVRTVFRSGEDYGSIQDVITKLAACQLSVPIPSRVLFSSLGKLIHFSNIRLYHHSFLYLFPVPGISLAGR